jgi:hypothetical protein
MNALRGCTDKLPGWARAVTVGLLFVLAAALFAQNHPANKNNNPPPKGQPAGHAPQASGHAASGPNTHSGGSASGPNTHSGGSAGGRQIQANRSVDRPTTTNSVRPGGSRPGSSMGHPGGGNMGAHGAAGHPMVSRTANGTIYRGPGGQQRIVHRLPGGGVAVTNGRGHGYVQRSVNVRGHVFVQRTYYVGGRPQARFYRPYYYHGVAFNVYAPLRFYSPGFYAWAYSPWAAPINYNWGWAGNPWFGYYGGYFAPYPSYASPNLWLTDYLLSTSLQEAYQERMDAAAAANAQAPPPAAAAAPGGQVALTPEVKQVISDEIRQQLAQESAESQSAQAPQSAAPNPEPTAAAPPPALSPNVQHIFIVSSVIVVSADGQQCAVTQGDVLQLDPAAQYPDPSNAKVLASKTLDCQSGKAVQVALADLQEMQNHMREMLDKGLGELQTRQGQGNLPVIDASLRTQTPAPYAADLPAPDANVASELQQTAQAATAPATQAPPRRPVTVNLGQTIDQVVASMGQPPTKLNVGQKDIYVYKDLKITFTGGKVSDVQ